jgi:c-di-GMP-binding flagellar brake protein YcgR
MGEERLRQNVRLRADTADGSVCLRRAGAPALTCRLLDLSEAGCRCLVPATGAEAWESFLKTGAALEAEITFEPYLRATKVAAEVRSRIPEEGGGFHLGLFFRDLPPEKRNTLSQAMLAIASEKIRISRIILKRTTMTGERPASEGASADAPKPPAPMKLEDLMAQLDKPALAVTSSSVLRAEKPNARRRYPRYPMAFPATYQFCGETGEPIDEALFRGRVVDISEGGIRLEGPLLEKVNPDDLKRGSVRLLVHVSVPEELTGLCRSRVCKVLKAAEEAAPAQYAFGLQIIRMEDEQRRVLTQTLMRVTRAGTRGPLPEE